mgnify:FL=1
MITLIILIILFKIKKKYKFVIENNLAILELFKLNKEYRFYNIKNLDEKHIYDNQDMFNEISCYDYLVYQLQFKQKEAKEQIQLCEYNYSLYQKYIKRISDISLLENDYKVEIKKSKKDKLKKYVQKVSANNIAKPITKFNIKVKLAYIQRYYFSKNETFDGNTVLNTIKRLNDKNGNFYNDRAIWDSICKVERGKVTNKMRFAIYRRDNYQCCYCHSRVNLEIDHIKPISKGGKSTYDNLQTLCHKCNVEKGNRY